METWEPPAVQDLPGCAIFGAWPFCEQWDVLHGTLRSQTLAEQSKQQEPKKKMDLRILQQLCQSPLV